ncbi:arylsulfatase [Coraliomargarita sinensis]|uniref:Arylsulfatase n=1 Tax=Coraliomargarita sinensis TaxID=2174842 RepID=A0A317ZG12_9BACT|nr:sulfatase-like hydrolase/transferase [Coraliomargarita sinensis]PXA04564.1 arylsulfatase [Coraliomargarita sinensis]
MKSTFHTCLALFLLTTTALHAESERASAGRPNIIFIMADDLGYETIGAYGGTSYQTPHIDRLAEMGARFEHCYAQPLCTPSRVKLMTGRYNVRNYRKFGILPRNETTFAQLFREAGYTTAIAGKWQLGKEPDAPRHFGFDEALLWQHTMGRTRENGRDSRFENPLLERNGNILDYRNGEYGPELLTDFVCDFIANNRDRPFLVYYPMLLTHCPFIPTPDSEEWDPKSMGSPTYKGDAKYFGDMVRYMDKIVGRIVDEVERQGLSENTIIFFTGDNGTDRPVVSMLNGRKVAWGKGKTTDAGTRVPLVVYGPGTVKSQVIRNLVDFSDFFPTLCDLAGISTPESLPLDGRSFLPQLNGQEGQPREHLYCWYSSSGKPEKAKIFARTHRYKLYQSGDFFDLSQDVLEEQPLLASQLTPEQKEIRSQFQTVIEENSKLRPE